MFFVLERRSMAFNSRVSSSSHKPRTSSARATARKVHEQNFKCLSHQGTACQVRGRGGVPMYGLSPELSKTSLAAAGLRTAKKMKLEKNTLLVLRT